MSPSIVPKILYEDENSLSSDFTVTTACEKCVKSFVVTVTDRALISLFIVTDEIVDNASK